MLEVAGLVKTYSGGDQVLLGVVVVSEAISAYFRKRVA
jgi:hypothetical protein